MAVGTEKRVIRTNMVREQNHVASRKIKRKEHTVKELVLYSKSTPVTLSVLVKPTKLKGGSDDDTHHRVRTKYTAAPGLARRNLAVTGILTSGFDAIKIDADETPMLWFGVRLLLYTMISQLTCISY
jgi:hypothetical protein